MTDWQRHARWQLGEVTDAEYADGLVADGVPADDPIILTLRERAGRQPTTRGDDVAREPDDNTLDNAGEVGRELADTMSTKITETIDGFPGLAQQRAAIARIVANTLYDYAEEVER